MREMIVGVSGIIAPIALCVLIGFGIAKAKLQYDHKMVGSLVWTVGYPALILSNLTGQDALLDELLGVMLAAAVVVACFGVIGFGIVKLMRLPVRAYLSPMMLNNAGNIGLPVCTLAFGEQGLVLGVGFLVVMMIGTSTIGVWLPMGKFTLTELLRQPVIYAVALSLVLMATEIDLPKPINGAFEILGGLAIPLMLLTLGHTLATLNVAVLSRGVALSVLHLIMAAAVAFSLVRLLGLDGLARGVFILQCMMPAQVASYLWVERYDPDEAPGVAGFILVSTILAVVVLPVVLTFWI